MLKISWNKLLFISTALVGFSLAFEGLSVFNNWGSITRLLGLIQGVVLIAAIVSSRSIRQKFIKNVFSPLSILLLFFILWCAITLFWTPQFSVGFTKLGTYLRLLTIVYALSVLSPDSIVNVWEFMTLGVAASFLWGLFNPIQRYAEVGRFSASNLDPNYYANYVVIVVFVNLVMMEEKMMEEKKNGKFLFFVLTGMSIGVVILTGSRTGFINVIVMFLVYFFLIRKPFLKKILIVILISSFGFIFIEGLKLLNDEFLTYVYMTFSRIETMKQIGAESTWSGRLGIWKDFFNVFQYSPWVGIGLGATGKASFYLSPSLQNLMLSGALGRASHNTFLSLAVETGAIGLTLYVLIQLRIFNSFLKSRNHIIRGLLLAVIGYWVASSTLSWETHKLLFFIYGSSMAIFYNCLPRQC